MVKVDDPGFSQGAQSVLDRVLRLLVDRGERTATDGPGGGCKTTLLNLGAGIPSAHEGRVDFPGTDLCPLSDAEHRRFGAKNNGCLFQACALLEILPVRQRDERDTILE